MCYNTKLTRKVENLEKWLGVRLYPKQEGSREVFDKPVYHNSGFLHPNQLIIPLEAADYLITAKWGIAHETVKPKYLKDYYKEQYKVGQGLNAQSEKAFGFYYQRYNRAILYRRCIIPVDGFYESHRLPNKVSVPFHVKRKDEGILSLAGIYSVLEGGLCTFTILTKKASALFEELHNSKKRQPLILDDETIKTWLNKSTSEADIKRLLNYEFSNNNLSIYPISRDFNNATIDTNVPCITNKIDYSTAPEAINGFDLKTYKHQHLFH
jgi:putative SOS response-associated peptidase YedK